MKGYVFRNVKGMGMWTSEPARGKFSRIFGEPKKESEGTEEDQDDSDERDE